MYKYITIHLRSLFQMSIKTGKRLDLHDSSSDDAPRFAADGIGRDSLGQAIPSLCRVAGVPVLHNRYAVDVMILVDVPIS